MRTLLIVTSFLLLYIGIVLAAWDEYSIKPQINYTAVDLKSQPIFSPDNNFSIKQIDSLTAAGNYYFTLQNSVKNN